MICVAASDTRHYSVYVGSVVVIDISTQDGDIACHVARPATVGITTVEAHAVLESERACLCRTGIIHPRCNQDLISAGCSIESSLKVSIRICPRCPAIRTSRGLIDIDHASLRHYSCHDQQQYEYCNQAPCQSAARCTHFTSLLSPS